MKRFKILMLTTFFHPDKFGGAERVVFELSRHLAGLGQAVTVLTHQPAGRPAKEHLAGIRVLRYPAPFSGPWSFYTAIYKGVRRSLKQLLAEESFEIVHTHQLCSAFSQAFPDTLVKCGRVASFYAPYHQEFESKFLEGRPASESAGRLPLRKAMISRVLKWADRYVLAKAQAVIVLSRFSLSQVTTLAASAASRTHVIPAGVDLDRFKPPADRRERKKSLGLPQDRPLILSVRRLVERMGLEDLIDAAALLAKRGLAFEAVLAGEGPLGPSLKARARASAARACFRFQGAIPEEALPDWYGAADLFVLPSRSLEGFGMVTLEALASGVPVAATRVGASSEILEALDPGLLIDTPGPGALADRLERLLEDPGGLAALGQRARTLAEKRYTWPAAAERTLEIYRNVWGLIP